MTDAVLLGFFILLKFEVEIEVLAAFGTDYQTD